MAPAITTQPSSSKIDPGENVVITTIVSPRAAVSYWRTQSVLAGVLADLLGMGWAIGAVALLTFGEGLQNNHHAFPTSYRHGMRRWQIDISAWVIWVLERTGLAWDVVRVSPERQRRQRTPCHRRLPPPWRLTRITSNQALPSHLCSVPIQAHQS